MKNLTNIIEAAATLVIEGKATPETAVQMAIQQDNQRIVKTMEAVQDIRAGYSMDTKWQNGYRTVQKSVTKRLY